MTVRLYRTVSRPEYADLQARGSYRPYGAANGKYFWETLGAAQMFGERTAGHYRPAGYRIVGPDGPAPVAASFYRWARLDGVGPALFAPADQLRWCTVVLLTEP